MKQKITQNIDNNCKNPASYAFRFVILDLLKALKEMVLCDIKLQKPNCKYIVPVSIIEGLLDKPIKYSEAPDNV